MSRHQAIFVLNATGRQNVFISKFKTNPEPTSRPQATHSCCVLTNCLNNRTKSGTDPVACISKMYRKIALKILCPALSSPLVLHSRSSRGQRKKNKGHIQIQRLNVARLKVAFPVPRILNVSEDSVEVSKFPGIMTVTAFLLIRTI